MTRDSSVVHMSSPPQGQALSCSLHPKASGELTTQDILLVLGKLMVSMFYRKYVKGHLQRKVTIHTLSQSGNSVRSKALG